MGLASFDKNGAATLALNTAGPEKADHIYKLTYRRNDGKTMKEMIFIINQIMRIYEYQAKENEYALTSG